MSHGHFSRFRYTTVSVLALGYCHNFVSAQYLGNKLMEYLTGFASVLMLTSSRIRIVTRQF